MHPIYSPQRARVLVRPMRHESQALTSSAACLSTMQCRVSRRETLRVSSQRFAATARHIVVFSLPLHLTSPVDSAERGHAHGRLPTKPDPPQRRLTFEFQTIWHALQAPAPLRHCRVSLNKTAFAPMNATCSTCLPMPIFCGVSIHPP